MQNPVTVPFVDSMDLQAYTSHLHDSRLFYSQPLNFYQNVLWPLIAVLIRPFSHTDLAPLLLSTVSVVAPTGSL
jgi:hypothetical protein